MPIPLSWNFFRINSQIGSSFLTPKKSLFIDPFWIFLYAMWSDLISQLLSMSFDNRLSFWLWIEILVLNIRRHLETSLLLPILKDSFRCFRNSSGETFETTYIALWFSRNQTVILHKVISQCILIVPSILLLFFCLHQLFQVLLDVLLSIWIYFSPIEVFFLHSSLRTTKSKMADLMTPRPIKNFLILCGASWGLQYLWFYFIRHEEISKRWWNL